MAFIPTPHAARIVINWVKGTETFSYVWYATMAGYTYEQMVTLASAVAVVHNGTRKAYFASQVSYVNTTVYDARVSDGPIVTSTVNAGAGTGASELMAISLAVCVTLRTAERGRSARGRKYITGFGEGNNANGEWSASAVTNANEYVGAIREAIESAGFTPVIRSIQQDGQPINPAATRAITGSLVRNTKVATQRRRVDRA